MNLFPLATWDLCDNDEADSALVSWGHWLGGCNRPFGRQSFSLRLEGHLAAVAVSASTVNATCAGIPRQECIEFARLCADPANRDLTRVALRLWRVTAAKVWPYWKARAYVSYANAIRHKGDIYRFDGWRKAAEVKGGVAGGSWQRGKKYDAKSVWVFDMVSMPIAQAS